MLKGRGAAGMHAACYHLTNKPRAGGWRACTASFPFIRDICGSRGDARLGADIGAGGRVGDERRARRCTHPGFLSIWGNPFLTGGLEPTPSGPGPVTNRSRRNGVSDIYQFVGDYTNPILKPWAAEALKKLGEISLSGVTYPTPGNQCWPEPLPFIFRNFGMQILQQPHQITILYSDNHEVRRVRLNQPHPAQVTPSWYGDSVGHYEGDTLLIDTIGIKIGPFAMIDVYGTP
jgi:hypothetical protein